MKRNVLSSRWNHDRVTYMRYCDCIVQSQCIDDEYTLDGELFTVDCRTAANTVLLDNLLRTDEFQPHGKSV